MQVPQTAFKSLNLVENLEVADFYDISDNVCQGLVIGDRGPTCPGIEHERVVYYYNGPSEEVRKVAFAAAAQGAILPVTAPAPDSSWGLIFPGPALKCSEVEDDVRLSVQQNILDYVFETDECAFGPGFLAWHPERHVGGGQIDR